MEYDECPLNGDTTNDCEGCVYSEDYHYVNGECVRRNQMECYQRKTGNDCSECIYGKYCHLVDGKCIEREDI